MDKEKDQTEARNLTSSIDSSFPCELPEDAALLLSSKDFDEHVAKVFADLKASKVAAANEARMAELSVEHQDGKPFIDALTNASAEPRMSEAERDLAEHNKMFTEKGDVAYKSTTSALLDLFVELERTMNGERLKELLDAAWKEDPLATLKIMWNARSIHLGKGEQDTFYQCLGWLKGDHPVTLLTNLQWLYRSVIEKKVKKEDDEAMEIIEKETLETDEFEVLHGVSHGYFKDLLNVLVLAVNGSLDALGNPREVLHKKNEQPKYVRKRERQDGDVRRFKRRKAKHIKIDKEGTVKGEKKEKVKHTRFGADDVPDPIRHIVKERKHALERERHERVLKHLEDPFYRCLHLSIARLFAQQLQIDKKLLESTDKISRSKISLAAKWAPSLEGFHDKHTLIATSIAEILFPRDHFPPDESREMYLKRAREAYRATYLTPLRRELDVVERKITEEAFNKINYAKIPSLAMDAYKELFIKKDFEHFEKYIEKVAEGKARISGAILTPGSLVRQSRSGADYTLWEARNAKTLMERKVAEIERKTLDGQWATLVKRIKDNGSLAGTMAVADVSGSMTGPVFADKTCPLDHSIGLSLLIAEVVDKPFGGRFISFSEDPQVHAVGGPDDKSSLSQKINTIERSTWNMTTDFVAVFERLILPIAVKNKIKQEDMVKQLIVFSDMQFDQAEKNGYSKKASKWESSFEKIQRKYHKAGYEMPRLVFWNLPGGYRYGSVAPKPVTSREKNVLIVSGYSQGILKMFLDNGTFEEEAKEEEEVEVVKDEKGNVETKAIKKEVDPMAGVWRAISHKAYDMLKVVD